MGYGTDSLKYFGLKAGYVNFMESANSESDCSMKNFNKTKNIDEGPCIPTYKIAGGRCSKKDETVNQVITMTPFFGNHILTPNFYTIY